MTRLDGSDVMHELLVMILIFGLSACASRQVEPPTVLGETNKADVAIPGDRRESLEREANTTHSRTATLDRSRTEAKSGRAAKAGDAPTSELRTNMRAQKVDPSRQPAIVTAAASGNLKQVQALLKGGANVNAKTQDGGNTALHYASYGHQLDVVEALVESGADVNAKNSEAGFTPLMQATIRGDIAIARYLIGKGADVNETANSGNTALMLSAIPSLNVPADLVRLLLASGADLNIRNAYGYSALEIAENFNNSAVAKLLRNGNTPASDPATN